MNTTADNATLYWFRVTYWNYADQRECHRYFGTHAEAEKFCEDRYGILLVEEVPVTHFNMTDIGECLAGIRTELDTLLSLNPHEVNLTPSDAAVWWSSLCQARENLTSACEHIYKED